VKGTIAAAFLFGAFLACCVWPLLVLAYHIYRGQ
jgi:hypothetical protein